jgi:mono/diheme cytochrome c family protein
MGATRVLWSLLAAIVIGGAWSTSLVAHVPQHSETAHHHPEAAKLKNPVPSDATSIAEGGKLFARFCSDCHGPSGKGDGMMGDELDPKPANLTTGQFKHGDSDGEIYTVVKNGIKGTGMKSFARKLKTTEIWEVVNYVHSLGPKPATNH